MRLKLGGAISPAIFGSMFQSVMDEKARRNLGAHYTSEKNILKLIKPLFLDELTAEFEKIKNDKGKLNNFHKKIAGLKFLDPACGCGNFLVISYRELRLLELEVLKALQKGQQVTTISQLVRVDVDQFYGIEYEEFPAQIAQVAMWLMDHQMNMQVSEAFGEYYRRLPLRKAPTIRHGNALRIDWQSLINPIPFEKGPQIYNYIFGNPPFIGTAYQKEEQKEDVRIVFGNINSSGMLDYVCCWYLLAARYITQYNSESLKIKCAFVSTNSITQGEQPGILWSQLFAVYRVKIHFAHRTFCWSNEAKGKAAVHVVIIGFSNFDITNKVIFEYDHIKGEPHATPATNINPYLVDGKDSFLNSISQPLCQVPRMQSGSAARDGGFLILSDEDKLALVKKNPRAKGYLKRFISGDDFLNNVMRWCIWLKDWKPNDIRVLNELSERFKEVQAFRQKSTRLGTRKMAEVPYLFAEERQPTEDFLLIPKVSSENRKYIPIAYLDKDYIVSDKTFLIPQTTFFHFGILTSLMHNTWMRYTCGRLESRYSYSNTIVYNNYPWPENPTDKQKEAVEKAAQKVLDARAQFPDSSLADLYDPLSMPSALVKAHQELDKAVDLCYRPQPFVNETKRIEFLFDLYDKYTSGLFVQDKKTKKKKKAE